MKLTVRNKAAFCLGAFGKDIVYMLVNSYVLYYYNTVLGMSATFIGAVLMGARIFDALNDPFMGVVVAKTNTKHGRYRPWILTGSIMNAVIIYALFAVPDGMGDTAETSCSPSMPLTSSKWHTMTRAWTPASVRPAPVTST